MQASGQLSNRMETARIAGNIIDHGDFITRSPQDQVVLIRQLCAPLCDIATGLPRPAQAARLRTCVACARPRADKSDLKLPQDRLCCVLLDFITKYIAGMPNKTSAPQVQAHTERAAKWALRVVGMLGSAGMVPSDACALFSLLAVPQLSQNADANAAEMARCARRRRRS